jgi:hypothetical protein
VRKLDQYVWAGQGHPSRRQAARDAERSPRETTAPAAGGRPVAGSAGRVQVLPARRSPWLISWATTLPSPAAAVVMDAASLDAVSAQRDMSLRWILPRPSGPAPQRRRRSRDRVAFDGPSAETLCAIGTARRTVPPCSRRPLERSSCRSSLRPVPVLSLSNCVAHGVAETAPVGDRPLSEAARAYGLRLRPDLARSRTSSLA